MNWVDGERGSKHVEAVWAKDEAVSKEAFSKEAFSKETFGKGKEKRKRACYWNLRGFRGGHCPEPLSRAAVPSRCPEPLSRVASFGCRTRAAKPNAWLAEAAYNVANESPRRHAL